MCRNDRIEGRGEKMNQQQRDRGQGQWMFRERGSHLQLEG